MLFNLHFDLVRAMASIVFIAKYVHVVGFRKDQ